MLKLNKIQRGVAIGTAAVIALIQLTSILENGVGENRGWVWALVAASALLVVGFATGSDSPRSPAAIRPTRPLRKPSTDDLRGFAGEVGRSIGLINANSLAAEKILEFVMSTERYHTDGPIAFAFDPQIHSPLAAHAIFLLAIKTGDVSTDTLVWETYRSTLANRLADRRYKVLVDGGAINSSTESASIPEIRRILVDQVKGEIKMWEDVLPVADDISPRDLNRIARLAAAVFGGRKDESDEAAFIPLFEPLFADAVSSLPILAGKVST